MDIGRCLNDALAVYKRNLPQLVVAAFLFEVLSLLSATILTGPLIGGWCVMTVNALRREDKYVDLGDLFRGFGKFLSLAGWFYLTIVPILLGLAFFLLPGIWLMTIWFFSAFLIVDRNEGVFESLRTSRQMVTASGFGNYFLLVVLVTAISLAPTAIPYAGIVIAWFITPIAWLIEAAAYVQETDNKKGALK